MMREPTFNSIRRRKPAVSVCGARFTRDSALALTCTAIVVWLLLYSWHWASQEAQVTAAAVLVNALGAPSSGVALLVAAASADGAHRTQDTLDSALLSTNAREVAIIVSHSSEEAAKEARSSSGNENVKIAHVVCAPTAVTRFLSFGGLLSSSSAATERAACARFLRRVAFSAYSLAAKSTLTVRAGVVLSKDALQYPSWLTREMKRDYEEHADEFVCALYNKQSKQCTSEVAVVRGVSLPLSELNEALLCSRAAYERTKCAPSNPAHTLQALRSRVLAPDDSDSHVIRSSLLAEELDSLRLILLESDDPMAEADACTNVRQTLPTTTTRTTTTTTAAATTTAKTEAKPLKRPKVECHLSVEPNVPVVIELWPEIAPNGVQRFLELVRDDFFTDCPLFRAVEGFLVQFGVNADPEITRKWMLKGDIEDDKWVPEDHDGQQKPQFEPGYLSFAGGGPNTRGTQVFFAFEALDGFGRELWETPLGKVIENFDTVRKIYKGYGDCKPFNKGGVDQGRLMQEGLPYIEREFPLLDRILECKVISEE